MFRKMDEIEVEISKIEELKMVHIYEVAGTDKQGVGIGCTAIAIYYGDNGKMNINDLDIHFEILANRVVELYSSSPDKMSIMMDDDTRAILENGIVNHYEDELNIFYQADSVECPKISVKSMLSKRLLPIASYLVVNLYKTLGFEVSVTRMRTGWRGRSELCVSDGINERMMFVQSEILDSKRYTINVSEFLEGHVPLFIDVKFEYNCMVISFKTSDGCFNGRGVYNFGYDKMTENYEVFYNDKPVFFGSNDAGGNEYPGSDLPEKAKKLFLSDKNIRCMYKLPWGLTYVLGDEYYKDDKTETYVYIGMYESEGVAELYGWTDIYNRASNIRLRTANMKLNRMMLDDDFIQTYFEEIDGNCTGTYKSKLANNYYILK